MISLVFIALSLSLDAFAVSISSAICIRNLKIFHALRASFFFGIFQFAMPVAGWYLGSAFASYIAAYDHWIAFVLLAFVGGKMIFEALRTGKGFRKNNNVPQPQGDCTEGAPCGGSSEETLCKEGPDIRSLGTLLTLAVATSIDALAVGVSLSMLGREIWWDAAVIGAITFLVCLSGFEFGRRIGALPEKWASIVGGLVLIGIGIKILLEHLPEG
ncbi:MAG: manganese efflux pump MntP family protein [Treponema sp.]|jgi:putative Mn2+ efflux pump MntP|nr:manganese efflux pump MntP family protein [Treponema sp.]